MMLKIKITSSTYDGNYYSDFYQNSNKSDVEVVNFSNPTEDYFVVVDLPHINDKDQIIKSKTILLKTDDSDYDPFEFLLVKKLKVKKLKVKKIQDDILDIICQILVDRQRQINFVNSKLNMYCITLDRSFERFETSKKEFIKYGLDVTKIRAVDGNLITYDELKQKNIVSEYLDHITKNQKGQLGLIETTYNLWTQISQTIDTCMKWDLIFEDDIKFHPDFLELFEKYWNEVPSDAEIVFISFHHPYKVDPYDELGLSNLTHNANTNSNVIKLHTMVNGNHAYAINKNSAKKLLNHFVPFRSAVDKFPPDKYNIYAFKRPHHVTQNDVTKNDITNNNITKNDITKHIVDNLYIDHEIWNGQWPITMYGLAGTRSEKSQLDHIIHRYMWFADNEIGQGNYTKALDYLSKMVDNLDIYDLTAINFTLWYKIILIAHYSDSQTGINAINELTKRINTNEFKTELPKHKIQLLEALSNYDTSNNGVLQSTCDEISLIEHAKTERIAGNYSKAFEYLSKLLETENENTCNFSLWDELGSVTYYIGKKDIGVYAFKKIIEFSKKKDPESLKQMKEHGTRILQNMRYYDCPDLCNDFEIILNNCRVSVNLTV